LRTWFPEGLERELADSSKLRCYAKEVDIPKAPHHAMQVVMYAASDYVLV
jgi:hypothetical protein